MYKHIKTYLLVAASVMLAVYFIVCGSIMNASNYADKSYTSIHKKASSSIEGKKALSFNFSSPIHPVKAVKPEITVDHVSERSRLVFHLLFLGVLYLALISGPAQKGAYYTHQEPFFHVIPIFILFRRIVI